MTHDGARHPLAVDFVVHPRGEADGLQPFAFDALTRKRLGAVAKRQHRRQRSGAHDDAER